MDPKAPRPAAPRDDTIPADVGPDYVPYVPPPVGNSILTQPLRPLTWTDPWHWLALGWQDFRRCPRIGLFYGTCFALMGHALWWMFEAAPAYVLALSAGFLLMGPFLCLGLYHASRALEAGLAPRLRDSLVAWLPTQGAMALFAGVLLILEMLWGRASMVVFAVSFNTIPATEHLWQTLLQTENLEFLLVYLGVGGVFAGLIYVISVVSIPMILDRQVDAISAGLTSLRACLQNPGVMLLWGAVVTVTVTLAMLPGFAGLLVVAPIIGHATWHAYRAIVPPVGEDDPPPA